MMPNLLKNNLMLIIKQLPDEDIMFVQMYIETLERQYNNLLDDNVELSKRIANTSKFINKIKRTSDYINGIACDDMLDLLEGKNGKIN